MEIPRVGVGIIVLRNKKVLLGKRKSAHGRGTWSIPGGHLEFGEEIEDCAARELEEETGMKIASLRRGPFTNNIHASEGRHSVTVYIIATAQGEPRVAEPDKCEKWEWFEWDKLPSPLFVPIENLVKMGFDPFT